MTKTELKNKTKDELIEMIKHLELVIDEIKKQTGTGEKVVNAVSNVYERILDFNIYKIRHDVCEKIKLYAKTELKKNLYISEKLFFNYLDKIGRGEI